MRRTLALLAPLLAAAPAVSQTPSFDCRVAATPVERLTCATTRLAELDVALAQAYRDHLAAARSPGDREARTAEQRRWLTGRAANCPMVASPTDAARNVAAACLQSQTEHRIARLALDRHRAQWPVVPFVPRLVRGTGPLCEGLARDLEASFRSPFVTVNPLGEREFAFSPLPRLDDDTVLGASVDLYGNGRPATLLRIEGEPSAHRLGTVQFRLHPANLLDRLARGAPPPDFAAAGLPLIDEAFRERLTPGPRETLPAALLDPQRTTMDAPRFLRDGTRILVLSEAVGPAGQQGDLGVYALTGPASRPREICLFVTGSPELTTGGGALYERHDVTAASLAALPLLPDWTCGSRDADRYTLAERAALRPWTIRPIPAGPDEVGTAALDPYLRARALSTLAAHRQYAAHRGARAAAMREVAAYYRTRFGRSEVEAAELAALYLDRSTADNLVIEADSPGAALLAPDYIPRRAIRAAALSGDLAALRAALEADPDAARRAPEFEWEDPLTALAVASPDALRELIRAGADPDAIGGSGRPALVVAAGTDAIEAAAILLQAGADVNASTRAPVTPDPEGDACLSAPEALSDATAGRTALSFAAGQGDAALVRLLLDHGADPSRIDAEGKRPADRTADPLLRDLLRPPR
ncbi:lysozyme inhibitor LprI family protein [Roseomonas sp. CCTCC AB2023176]|uniref:lysozyme inhibitor LprI family protein n=1 Tax=Roseomonas sp. CCTCC AB2023176 TaxID=3342640 RepID=UPI0035DA5A86